MGSYKSRQRSFKYQRSWRKIVSVSPKSFKYRCQKHGVKDYLEASREVDNRETAGAK